MSLLSVVLILLAVAAASLDRHAGLKFLTVCAICRVSHDLSSGDSAAPASLVMPGLCAIGSVLDSPRRFREISIPSLSTRGPPFYSG